MKETTTAESQNDDTPSCAAECHGHSKAQSKSLVCVIKSYIEQTILFFLCKKELMPSREPRSVNWFLVDASVILYPSE